MYTSRWWSLSKWQPVAVWHSWSNIYTRRQESRWTGHNSTEAAAG